MCACVLVVGIRVELVICVCVCMVVVVLNSYACRVATADLEFSTQNDTSES